jgi:hypothetical protein
MMWFPDAASVAFGLFLLLRGAVPDPPGTEAVLAADQDDLRAMPAAGWFFSTLTKPSSFSRRNDLPANPLVLPGAGVAIAVLPG